MTAKKSYVERVRTDRFSLWKGKGPLLWHLDIELTERCNNNCIHCYINLPKDDESAKERELSTDEWKAVLKEAARLGCLQVRMTGGEPLLREDFEDLYVFSRKLGLRVHVSTNATLINRNLAELFRRIPPMEKMDVTLYGMKRESYESISRRRGSFDAAMRGIGLLLDSGVPFEVRGILLPETEPEIEDFEAWAETIPGMEGLPSYVIFFDLHAWGKAERSRSIRRLRNSPQKGLTLLMRNREAYREAGRQLCARFMAPPGEKLFPCGAGLQSGCVNAYGGFQACLQLRHPDTLFDLRKGSLREALSEFVPRLRNRKAENPGYLKRCARCFIRGLCDQCPAKSWMEHGILDSPVDHLCRIAHLEACHLRLLEEGENAWEVKGTKARLASLREEMRGVPKKATDQEVDRL